MPDFNKILTPGDTDQGLVSAVIEIPKGSSLKIEWDRKSGVFTLDRVEPFIFAKPVNYGFIPGTIDDDGDELDTLVVCDEPLPTAVCVKARILGVLKFKDDGEMDHKIVCVPDDDRNSGDRFQSLSDLGERWQQQIEHHFSHYKDLKKPGSTEVLGWGDIEEAKSIIKDCIKRFQA